MSKGDQAINLKKPKSFVLELLIFYMPLAISAMLMMSSHSIVSSAMARTVNVEVALAAYAVASSIAMMFESPCYNIRQMAVSLFDDQTSLRTIFKIGFGLVLLCVGLMIPVAFTGFGKVVFINWAGVRPEIYPEVIKAFRLLMLMPLVSAVRAYYQSIIIVQKRTFWLTINVIVRLTVMVGMTTLILNTNFVEGSMVGAVILISGIGTEAFLALLVGLRYRKNFPDHPTKTKQSITARGALVFFIPLILASFAQTFSRPGINAGLARTANPELALASYQVAYSFAMIFIALLWSCHQLVLVFAKDRQTFRTVVKFGLVIAGAMSGVLLVCGLSPLGTWVLTTIIGVEAELAVLSLRIIAAFSVIPILVVLSEIFVGVLLMHKRTPSITLAKSANVITVLTVSTVLSANMPQLGGVIGAVAMTFGMLAEFSVEYWRSRDILTFK